MILVTYIRHVCEPLLHRNEVSGFSGFTPNFKILNNSVRNQVCDEYFEKHNTTIVQGIKGLSSGIFFENIWNAFMEKVRYYTVVGMVTRKTRNLDVFCNNTRRTR